LSKSSAPRRIPGGIYIFAIITVATRSKAIVRIAPTYLPLLFETSFKFAIFAYVACQRTPRTLPRRRFRAKSSSCPCLQLPSLDLSHVGPTCQSHLQPRAPPWLPISYCRRALPTADGLLPMAGGPHPMAAAASHDHRPHLQCPSQPRLDPNPAPFSFLGSLMPLPCRPASGHGRWRQPA
jgi:hypothetical protein